MLYISESDTIYVWTATAAVISAVADTGGVPSSTEPGVVFFCQLETLF